MYIAVLFITVKTGKQPRHPLVSEWVNKVWYIQTTEYYSELKGNELSSHEKTWISVVLSCSVLSHFSCVQLFAILWTIACQAPLSMGFSRQEYWSALPGPSQIKKYILLNERNQYERTTCCMIPTTWNFGKGKITETVVARGWEGRWEIWISRAQRNLGQWNYSI